MSSNSNGALSLNSIQVSPAAQTSALLAQLLYLEQYLQQMGYENQKMSIGLFQTATIAQAAASAENILQEAKNALWNAVSTFASVLISTVGLGIIAPRIATQGVNSQMKAQEEGLSNIDGWDTAIAARKNKILIGAAPPPPAPGAPAPVPANMSAAKKFDYAKYSAAPAGKPANPAEAAEYDNAQHAIETANSKELSAIEKRIQQQRTSYTEKLTSLSNKSGGIQTFCSMLAQAGNQVGPNIGIAVNTGISKYPQKAAEAKVQETLSSGTAGLIQKAMDGLSGIVQTAQSEMRTDLDALLIALSQLNTTRA